MSDAPSPDAIFIGGPNGSGKSSILRHVTRQPGATYICADEIAKELRKAGYTGTEERLAKKAAEMAVSKVIECVQHKKPFLYETVMSHPSKVQLMKTATNAGMASHLAFVALSDPSVNVERVAERVHQGGHDVPTDKVVSRYERTLSHLPDAMRAVKSGEVWDNTTEPVRFACIDNSRQVVTVERKVPEWALPAMRELGKTHSFEASKGMSRVDSLDVKRSLAALQDRGLSR